jgi:glutamyl-tRNA synthetase
VPKLLTADALLPLEKTCAHLKQLNDWHAEKIHHALNQVVHEFGFDNMGKIAQPLRLAISGSTTTPPIDVTLAILGKDKVIHRIERALAYINRKLVAD